ncbi:hypothetical protein ACFL0M_03250 [Thermodesulfobacteriota bacterium]
MADMDQYKDYTWDIITSVLAILALLGVGYVWYYQPLQSDINTLSSSYSRINKEIRRINVKLEEAKEESKKASSAIKTIPGFLTRINKIANETNVYLDTVEPVTGNRFQYDISFAAKYFVFIRFLLGLETLNVVIDDISINPFEGPRDDPTQAVNFKITLLGQGEQVDDIKLDQLRKKVAATGNRNPFRMGLPGEGLTDVIDLTPRWKLSAFGSGPPPFVYINGNRYYKGTSIGPKKITAIFINSHVELEEKKFNGIQKYILKTRPKPKIRK